MTFFKTRRVLSTCAFFGISIVLGFIYFFVINLNHKKYNCELYDKGYNQRCMNGVILDFHLSNGMNCSFCECSLFPDIDYNNRTCFYNNDTCFFGISIIFSDWIYFIFYVTISMWFGFIFLMCFGINDKNTCIDLKGYEKI